MNKHISVLLFVSFILIMVPNTSVKAESVENDSNVQNILENQKNIKDEISSLNKYSNIESLNLIKNNVYDRLSPYMKAKSKLYDIYIIDNDITNVSIYKNQKINAIGTINYTYSFILIQNTTYNGTRTPEYTLIHELGHVLDTYDELDGYKQKTTGKYSNINEFKDIFDEEKYYLKDLSKEYYFTDKINEYFAESYAIYMNNPTEMKIKAPKTFAFIDKVSNEKIS